MSCVREKRGSDFVRLRVCMADPKGTMQEGGAGGFGAREVHERVPSNE